MTYYVVYHGRVPGVYEDWEDCRRQVHRFSGNSYKGYTTLEEAETRYANFRAGQRREMWRTPFIVMMLAATASLVYYWSLAQYFGSPNATTRKDYTRIRGVLDEAILGYSKNGGTFDKKGEFIRADTGKHGFKHVTDFPYIKQPVDSM
ncbi:hypothetical protein QYE76_045907 [Lolium multiflorum]|uniref:Ribonuclease H n=1 Tax=Lolium multiflorum TaxID=4521 RepID=A0AAD8TL63_LOLMU|nr:hypothetical protein QYE76_045907 [Lolium multiflorum]